MYRLCNLNLELKLFFMYFIIRFFNLITELKKIKVILKLIRYQKEIFYFLNLTIYFTCINGINNIYK